MSAERDAFAASLEYAVNEAYDSGLFEEFCRLYGYPLPRSGIDGLVDRACGLEEKRLREFVTFVRRYVWEPWLVEMITGDVARHSGGAG